MVSKRQRRALLQESICAAWPKHAPWRAPFLPATVNQWPASEAGHRGARCGKRVYRGRSPYLPAAGNRYLPWRTPFNARHGKSEAQ